MSRDGGGALLQQAGLGGMPHLMPDLGMRDGTLCVRRDCALSPPDQEIYTKDAFTLVLSD